MSKQMAQNVTPLRDYLGRELEIGRLIIYAGLPGIVRIGMIRSLHPSGSPMTGSKKVGIYSSRGRKASLWHSDRLVQVDDWMVLDESVKRVLLPLRSAVLGPLR